MKKVKKSVMSKFQDTFVSIDKDISSTVKKPLEDSLKTFFDSFKEIVEAIRADFLAAMEDKKKDKQEQNAIDKSLSHFATTISAMKDDLEDLKVESDKVV